MKLYNSKYHGSRPLAALFDAFVRLYLRLDVRGREHLPDRGPLLLAANHSSHADTAVIYASLPRRFRRQVVAAAARDYFFDNPLRRASARMLFNAVPVDRRPEPRRDPLRHPIRALRQGYGVLIYPEGTRSQDGSINQFRGGIGRLIALFPNVPVIPVWLDTADVMPKGSLAPRPRVVAVRFGPPLALAARPDDRASWQAAAEAVRAAVARLRDAGEPAMPPAQKEIAAGDMATSDSAGWRRRWPKLREIGRLPSWLRWPRRERAEDSTGPGDTER
jgi:1-acyl-sn-glycerol-3-phosphate acyltransferase